MSKKEVIEASEKTSKVGKNIKRFVRPVIAVVLMGIVAVTGYMLWSDIQNYRNLSYEKSGQVDALTKVKLDLEVQLAAVQAEYRALQAVDQVVRNDLLEATISAIEKTYTGVVDVYEALLKLKELAKDTTKFDDRFTKILTMLSEHNYASASASILSLNTDIAAEQKKIADSFIIPKNVVESNNAPGSGYSRQQVTTQFGNFMVDIVAGDMGSTRVIVDTASGGTCTNDCPVLSLGDYVSRNGAYAGINGAYFCPASYPNCAGKTNSFDTLLMNKDKVYFNSDNNVYSTVPAVIFGSGWVRFVGASQEWGRDTGIDSMIANQPLLVSGSSNVFGGDGDPKKGSKAGRSFVASKGNTVYIGVVWSSTVVEAAEVLTVMDMDYALNLDSGGSTAFWSGGYKAGPGRSIPNAILFVKK